MSQTTNGNGSTYQAADSTASNAANEGAAARERLMGDLKSAIGDAEKWLREAASTGAEGIDEAKSQFQDTLRTAKTNLLTLEDTVLAKSKLAAQCADTYVHDNPWRSVVIGGVIGLLAGVIISRD